MIDKLKEVLKLYQDEPCTLDGVRCKGCKFNMNVELELFNDQGKRQLLCDVLEELSEVLEVV